jgi:hypothetical protein
VIPADPGTPHRFRVGDRVRVRTEVAGGNPRTPPHVRGRTGVVVACHGVIVNPLDHHDAYPPMCSVAFVLADGPGGRDELVAEVHEEWLELAT